MWAQTDGLQCSGLHDDAAMVRQRGHKQPEADAETRPDQVAVMCYRPSAHDGSTRGHVKLGDEAHKPPTAAPPATRGTRAGGDAAARGGLGQQRAVENCL